MSTEAVSLPCSHDMRQLRSPLYDVPEKSANWGGLKIHFVKRKSNRDGKFRNVETRFQSSPKVKGFQYKLKSGLDEI